MAKKALLMILYSDSVLGQPVGYISALSTSGKR